MASTIELSSLQAERIKRRYQPLEQPSPTPYHDFYAKGEGFTLSLYKGEETEKLVIQGRKAEEEEAKIRRFLLIPNRPRTCPVPIAELGSDEVGTGDYFGPIVVVAAYLDNRTCQLAKKAGATDSKLLTDERIRQIYAELNRLIDFSAVIISPKKYNEGHGKGLNMNAIKAKMHNAALLKLHDRHPEARMCIDQFAEPGVYFSYLKDEQRIAKPLLFSTKGELSFLSVAVASVFARALFLEKMAEYSAELGVELPFGAGKDVDSFAKRLVKEKGEAALAEYAKISFKNTKKILG